MILLFAFDDYYPGGGIADLVDHFDSLDAAIECLATLRMNKKSAEYRYAENAHAYEVETRTTTWWSWGEGRGGKKPPIGYASEQVTAEPQAQGWWRITEDENERTHR